MRHTVTEHKLANGAAGLVVSMPGTSVVNLVMRFNSGFQFADRAQYEIPHVMEHLIGCGSGKYSEVGQLKIEFQRNGAYRNAYTTSGVNGYVVECAAFELERILDLVEEYMAHPTFPAEALPAEISNVREELSRFTTQHSAVCQMALAEKAFPRENLNFDSRLEQLSSFTLDRVVKHYHDTHTSANARFYVAGSFADGGQEIVKRLEHILDQRPRGQRLRLLGAAGLGQDAPVVTQHEIKQIYYNVGLYAGESPEHLRDPLALLRMILTGGFQSRIYGEARRRGLAYLITSGAFMGPGETSFGFDGYVTEANIKELFELIAREYRAVREGHITESELQAAKDLIIGSSLRSHQTAEDMLGWYLGRYDREEIIRNFEEYHEALRAVTIEQVMEIAERLVEPKAHGVSLLGDVHEQQAQGYEKLLAPMWK